jgi:hypothetical protein
MAAILSLKFSIHTADGATQSISVDSVRALVGSGAHCEIRLPSEQCPDEQLVIEARNGGVYGEARCLNPPALLNGVPFTQGRILPESMLEVGGTRLQVLLGEASLEPGEKKQKTAGGRSPLMYVLGLFTLAFGGYVMLAPVPEDGVRATDVSPPALFPENARVTCPQGSAAGALALAADERLLADSKRERSPFRVEEGVLAVGHYERAAACFDQASDAASANEARADAKNLKQSLKSDFHVHSVRLERALATQEYERARTEIRVLLAFLSSRSGEYTTWLGTLDRRIQLKYSGENKESE